MAEVTALEMMRDLYGYHWWANRRLFEVTTALGEAMAAREVGTQFSFPTLTRMFAHIYGADSIWLSRWKGMSPAGLPGGDIRTLADLRGRWDALEAEQLAFLESLTGADLGRPVEYRNTTGTAFRVPLAPLLQHVANHATHHRSEIATMITMISGSPPDSGRALYETLRSKQGEPWG
jgi:uncharacterized damage-inducible protein DinB